MYWARWSEKEGSNTPEVNNSFAKFVIMLSIQFEDEAVTLVSSCIVRDKPKDFNKHSKLKRISDFDLKLIFKGLLFSFPVV